MTATTSSHVLRAADVAARAERHAPRWSPSSERVGTTLGRALGVHVVTSPPAEEWPYSVARIDGEAIEVVSEGT